MAGYRLSAEGFEKAWEEPQRTANFMQLLGGSKDRMLVGTNVPGLPALPTMEELTVRPDTLDARGLIDAAVLAGGGCCCAAWRHQWRLLRLLRGRAGPALARCPCQPLGPAAQPA